MNELELIEKTIKKIPKGKIFFPESIYKKYFTRNVNSVLTRLKKKGDIKRIIRGMYVRPKKSRYLKGKALMPDVCEIVKAISQKTGEVISIYGAAAENYVGLSTQIQVNAIYYTTGRSRHIKTSGKHSIKLVHISQKKLIMPGAITCIVVIALWYLGKDSVTPLLIKKIYHRLDPEEFSEVLKHLDKMPAWMKKVFVQYKNMRPDDPRLEEDLNSYYQG
jgi:hypothetical protein